MPSSNPLPRRKSLRLKDYDYTQAGAYFVTIVTQHRLCLFGDITEGRVALNAAGTMIDTWWQELNHKFQSITTDDYVIMPNHFHGVIVIHETPAPGSQSPGQSLGESPGQSHRIAPTVSLPQIVQWFKTMTTNAYIHGVKHSDWHPFPEKLWQRIYYEHVVRNDDDLNHIRRYIQDNPGNWLEDRNYPARSDRNAAILNLKPRKSCLAMAYPGAVRGPFFGRPLKK